MGKSTNKYILCFLVSLFFGFNFLYSAEISISPNTQTLSCQSSYDFFINMDTSTYDVLAADIKFFLEGFNFVSVQNQGGFDQLSYIGTGISTKGSNSGKVYHYINVYQDTFGDFVSGSNISIAKIKLSPKIGYSNGSFVFYNLFANDEDSNISVGTGFGVGNFPLKYNDSLLNTVDGNYVFGVCPPSGGGGGSSVSKDNCCLDGGLDGANEECIDSSDSYYDGTCLGGYHGSADICGVNESTHTDQLKGAYLYSYGYGITTMCPIWEADLDGYLYRNHFAKMISEYAVNVLGEEPIVGKDGCDMFSDIESDTEELKNFMKTSCELELMGMNPDGKTPMKNFNPYGIVTRAEFGTVFSRLLFGDEYNIKDNIVNYDDKSYWYKDHLNALKKYGVMTKIDGDWPNYLERRGWVMLMMKRADDYGLFFGKLPALNGIKALFE